MISVVFARLIVGTVLLALAVDPRSADRLGEAMEMKIGLRSSERENHAKANQRKTNRRRCRLETLISSNETAADSDRQPANVVDGPFAIARD